MEYNDNYYYDNDYTNEYEESDALNTPDLSLQKTNSYMILKEDQLLKEREKIIKEAMEFISLDRDEAILVLIFFNWSMDNIHDKWFDDVEKNSIKCGIKLIDNIDNKKLSKSKDCLICFQPYDTTFKSLKCNHNFCADCWNEYLSVKIEDFLTCLSSTCPQAGCNLIVTESFFQHLLTDKKSKERFNKAVLKNFVGYNSDIKICPGVSCNNSVKCDSYLSKEIKCECGTVFCFKCNKEAHRPCDCNIINKWEIRSKSDSENDKWIKANTKCCPHCNNKIEKSQGCNFMLCVKQVGGCGKAFCYVCEVDWEKHSQDHFKCNMYTPEVKEKENQANKIKLELQRYKFYFDRYMNYSSAVKFAEKLMPTLENMIHKLMSNKGLPLSELNFLKEALQTVISSKRTLKNSYVFGYYLKDGNEKKLFEYSQSFLERNSDNLHMLIEGESLKNIISQDNYDAFQKNFIEYKNKIINLCQATTTYQNNLMNDIEINMMHLIDEKLLETN
jgi:ariadne-1